MMGTCKRCHRLEILGDERICHPCHDELQTYERIHNKAYQLGYSEGYAARDRLSCANCGDGGKLDEK